MLIKEKSEKSIRNGQFEVVSRNLRETIRTLQVGEMLPSERELARRCLVSHATVRKALDVLEDNGFVKRYHGRGTVVANRLQQGEFAIVMTQGRTGSVRSPWYQIAADALNQILQKGSRNWQVKIHLGNPYVDEMSFAATLDLLQPDVLKRLRGVFSFVPLNEVGKALTEAGVPVVLFGDRETYGVWVDYQSFFLKALEHLRSVGCRSVGFLWHTEVADDLQPALGYERRSDFHEYAKNAGLRTKTEWMPYFATNRPLDETGLLCRHGEGGYNLFEQLWSLSDRPDGIVVVDEMLCRGVMRAVSTLGVRVPESLRIISYGNIGVDIPYIKPVTQVGFDPCQHVQKAVEMMMELIHGREPEKKQVLIAGKLIKGETT